MGMTLYQFRDKLQTDLKSATAWSTAELDRCVERAVQDLSRYLPLEKMYEETLDIDVSSESFTSPAATSATSIVNAKDISASVDGNTCTLATKSYSPSKTVKITVTDANASITSFTVIVKGIDSDGYYQEESFWFRGGLVQTGTKLFAYISEVEIDQITGNGASDTLSVGTGLHTGVWQKLANRPVDYQSETITSSPAGTTYTRDTDYEMDYSNGRVRLLSGGSMSAATAYLATYRKSYIGMDISTILESLIRIQRVEYPVGSVPQKFVSFSITGDFMYVGSQAVGSSQGRMSDGQHIAIYYEAAQKPPSTVSGGSYPEVLDEVIAVGAGAYALLIESLQYELQAETDITAMGTALTNAVKYLNNNSEADVAGILKDITDDAVNLRTAIQTAVAAVATTLGAVATTSLDKATTGAEAYLDTGDDKIDKIPTGENPVDDYAKYSQTRNAIANTRVSVALGYVQEAATRIQNLATYIQQAGGYQSLAQGFIQEAQYRAEQINGDLVMADRFKGEGIERLNEFYSILKTRSEYRRKTSTSSLQQPA